MPPGFLPVAAVLVSRAASLASYSAISRVAFLSAHLDLRACFGEPWRMV